MREAEELSATATCVLRGDTQVRETYFSTMLILSHTAEAVLPNRPSSSPGARGGSFNLFGRGKATEVSQGRLAASRHNAALRRSSVGWLLTAGNNHGLQTKGAQTVTQPAACRYESR